MGRIVGIIVGLVLLCAVFFAVVLGGAYFLTQGVATAGDNFMKAVQENRLEDAYALLAPSLQEEVDFDSFSSAFADSGLSTWSFPNRSVENNTGQVSGSAEINGNEYTVGLALENINDAWLIVGYDFSTVADDSEATEESE